MIPVVLYSLLATFLILIAIYVIRTYLFSAGFSKPWMWTFGTFFITSGSIILYHTATCKKPLVLGYGVLGFVTLYLLIETGMIFKAKRYLTVSRETARLAREVRESEERLKAIEARARSRIGSEILQIKPKKTKVVKRKVKKRTVKKKVKRKVKKKVRKRKK